MWWEVTEVAPQPSTIFFSISKNINFNVKYPLRAGAKFWDEMCVRKATCCSTALQSRQSACRWRSAVVGL